MKKRFISSHIILLIFLLLLTFASANTHLSNPTEEGASAQGKYVDSISTESNQQLPLKSSSLLMLSNPVTIIWPEPGYIYITDAMQLEVETSGQATCSYSLNGGSYEPMEVLNVTDHVHILYNLVDNEEGDPYIVDFKCVDGSGTEATAQTYFWISLDDLNTYLIRNNIDNWEFVHSELWWKGNDNGLLETYDAFYKVGETGLHALGEVSIFDNENSVNQYIAEVILNESIWHSNVRVINGQNVYFLQADSIKAASWKSENKLLFLMSYSYENSTPVDTQVPLNLLRAYLAKYPSGVRNGICGDGKVDVLNLNGQKEECDKNNESIDCGSSVGECKIGKKVRTCKPDCTWNDYGSCNATAPKPEKCDGKDNDCNGIIDNGFPPLGKSCSLGTGECNQTGTYVCSANGNATQCSAVPKSPQKENCLDGKDNDCDGLTDLKDVSDCSPLNILSPIAGLNYSNKKVLLSITGGSYIDELSYSFFDAKGKEIKVRLCTKCSSYNKTASFKDGFYNLTFAAWSNKTIVENKSIRFLVDSTAPKILSTLPKKGLAKGTFEVQFTENNPKSLVLHYNASQKTINLSSCNETKGKIYCRVFANITKFNDKTFSYYLELEDIAGNKITSKPVILIGDTTLPKLNSFNWSINKGAVHFVLNVTEKNFDKVSYLDWKDIKPTEKTLCSRLKNGICDTSKSFKTGPHNVTIYISDKALNIYSKNLAFSV
jgi:hypothetical protein